MSHFSLERWRSLGAERWLWLGLMIVLMGQSLWMAWLFPSALNFARIGLFVLLAYALLTRAPWALRAAALLIASRVAYVQWRAGFSFNFTSFIILATGLLAVWWLWTAARDVQAEQGDDDEEESEDRPIVSIVALLPELPFMDADVVRRGASHAWKVEFSADEDDDDATTFVVGEPPVIMVGREGVVYMVNVFDRPYLDDPESVASQAGNLRMARAIREHRAWISVDAMSEAPENEQQLTAAYAEIGRLLAELIDDDCLGLFFPQYQELYPYDPEMLAGLRSGAPRRAARELQQAPVAIIDSDDPRMKAAVAQARERWPEFVAAFEGRSEETSCAIKAPITREDQTEFIWINVTAIEGETIYGELANEPMALSGLSLGDRVVVPLDQLNDWLYVHPDEDMQGGFTVHLLQESARSHGEEQEPEE